MTTNVRLDEETIRAICSAYVERRFNLESLSTTTHCEREGPENTMTLKWIDVEAKTKVEASIVAGLAEGERRIEV